MEIAVGFDLHNTLMLSNEAWVEAYVELSSEANRLYVEKKVYDKCSRSKIASSLGLDYDEVVRVYHQKAKLDETMFKLLSTLKGKVPIYLISSASKLKVNNDLQSWNGWDYFDLILTREDFDKQSIKDWEKLISAEGLDLLLYIGNDIEEDIIKYDKIISLINGSFLEKLLKMNLLKQRGET